MESSHTATHTNTQHSVQAVRPLCSMWQLLQDKIETQMNRIPYRYRIGCDNIVIASLKYQI